MYSGLWLASCIFMVFGALAAAAGILLRALSVYKDPYQGHAEAKVVEILTEERTGEAAQSEFRNRQVAVFEFIAGGKPVKIRDWEDVYPTAYQINQKVKICYNIDNPLECVIQPANPMRRFGYVLEAVGMLLLISGGILFLRQAIR